MLQLRLDGRTYRYIAREAGASRQYVQQLLSPPPAIRNYVVEKYGGYCADCGIYVGHSGHVHHNGANGENYNDVENLELLCIACHRKRHKIPPCPKPINEAIKGMNVKKVIYYRIKCLRCGHTWESKSKHPLRCAGCKSPYWDRIKSL